jgi:Cytochrome C oxidase, cbb3-type, subunit III
MPNHVMRQLTKVIAIVLMLFAGQVASAQDFSRYSGEQLYRRFCASCHGADARGDGPVAQTLKVLVPDLTRLTRRQGEDFPTERMRRIIDGRDILAAHGARRMPVWGYEFASATVSEPEAGAKEAASLIDKLVEYLRSIQNPPAPDRP